MRRIMGTTKPTVRGAPFPSLSSVPSIGHYTAAKSHPGGVQEMSQAAPLRKFSFLSAQESLV